MHTKTLIWFLKQSCICCQWKNNFNFMIFSNFTLLSWYVQAVFPFCFGISENDKYFCMETANMKKSQALNAHKERTMGNLIILLYVHTVYSTPIFLSSLHIAEKVNVRLVDFHHSRSVIMYSQISCDSFFLELLSEKKIV